MTSTVYPITLGFVNAFLIQMARKGLFTVVIIDEAQRLSMETLEQLAPEPTGAKGDIGRALHEASTFWGETAPEAQLRDLAHRLA